MADLSGPVVRPSDGRGFDAALDARAAPGENETQFKAMLSLWSRVEVDDLPGFFFWHKPAFDIVHTHLIDIATIFYEYCKKGAAVGGAGKDASDGFTMSQREWVSMCKDGKVPVPIGEINDAHRRCDRPSKEQKEAALATKGGKAQADKQLVFCEFVEALIRLSVKLLATTSGGRKALKAGNGGEGFKKLMNRHILPLKQKDAMAEVRSSRSAGGEIEGRLGSHTRPVPLTFPQPQPPTPTSNPLLCGCAYRRARRSPPRQSPRCCTPSSPPSRSTSSRLQSARARYSTPQRSQWGLISPERRRC